MRIRQNHPSLGRRCIETWAWEVRQAEESRSEACYQLLQSEVANSQPRRTGSADPHRGRAADFGKWTSQKFVSQVDWVANLIMAPNRGKGRAKEFEDDLKPQKNGMCTCHCKIGSHNKAALLINRQTSTRKLMTASTRVEVTIALEKMTLQKVAGNTMWTSARANCEGEKMLRLGRSIEVPK